MKLVQLPSIVGIAVLFLFSNIVTAQTPCSLPTNLNATNITDTSATLSWTDSNAVSYNWKILVSIAHAGGAIIRVDSGTTANNTISTTMLSTSTYYSLYVEADCGAAGTSGFTLPYTFSTLCSGNPPITITMDTTNVACNGGNDGAVDLTVTGGLAPYTFYWHDGINFVAATEDINTLIVGQYVVNIVDSIGCTYLDSVIITELAALVVGVSSVADTNNLNTGIATASATGGTLPYTFTWDAAAGNATTAVVTGLGAGSYTVTVTDANNCTTSETVSIDSVLVNINNIESLTALKIFPNPTVGRLTIDLELSKSADIYVIIYNINGQIVRDLGHQNISNIQVNTDLSDLPNGVYTVKLVIDNQIISRRLLLSQ